MQALAPLKLSIPRAASKTVPNFQKNNLQQSLTDVGRHLERVTLSRVLLTTSNVTEPALPLRATKISSLVLPFFFVFSFPIIPRQVLAAQVSKADHTIRGKFE